MKADLDPLTHGLTELEQQLAGPDGEHRLSILMQEIDTLQERARVETQQGLSPNDYQRCSVIIDACTAARETLSCRQGGKTQGFIPRSTPAGPAGPISDY